MASCCQIVGRLALAATILGCDDTGEGSVRGTVTANGIEQANVAIAGWARILDDTASVLDPDSVYTRTASDGRYELHFSHFNYEGNVYVTLRFASDDTLLADTVLYTPLNLSYERPGGAVVDVALQPRH